MSHTDKWIDFTAGETFSLGGLVKTGLAGTLTAFAQLFDSSGDQVAVLEADIQPVAEAPAAPYEDYTHTLLITFAGDTSDWPAGNLKTNVLIVDGAGKKSASPAYVVRVKNELSEES